MQVRKVKSGNAGLVIGRRIGILTVMEGASVKTEVISVKEAQEIEAIWKGAVVSDPIAMLSKMLGGE